MRPHDIVGYTFQADTYCPACIVGALPTGEDGPFDGWALATGVDMSPEDNLSEIAIAFDIDRDDESTFDSGDFPKVVFRDSASDYPHTHDGEPERCGMCGEPLIETDSDLGDTCQGCPTRTGPVYPAGRPDHLPDCIECPTHCQCDVRRMSMFAGPDV